MVTRDGTVVIVDETDRDVITAYLVLQGYPPVSIEIIDVPSRPAQDGSPAYRVKS
jgi:hypothetical protein